MNVLTNLFQSPSWEFFSKHWWTKECPIINRFVVLPYQMFDQLIKEVHSMHCCFVHFSPPLSGYFADILLIQHGFWIVMTFQFNPCMVLCTQWWKIMKHIHFQAISIRFYMAWFFWGPFWDEETCRHVFIFLNQWQLFHASIGTLIWK